jgi:hypothetical protein
MMNTMMRKMMEKMRTEVSVREELLKMMMRTRMKKTKHLPLQTRDKDESLEQIGYDIFMIFYILNTK